MGSRVDAMTEQSPATTLVRWSGRTQAFVERQDGLVLTLLRIPAGVFLMGSPAHEAERFDREGPQHPVRLGEFLMAQTPITQAQWRVVAGWEAKAGEVWGRELLPNPSWFQIEGEASTDQRPVEQVTWLDAMEFCHRLRQRTGRTYTLPSEAQWEYACRAGTITPFHFGHTLTPDLANYGGNDSAASGPSVEAPKQTTPVGMFPANAWGLQDMHGNVQEWCLDHWHKSYERAPADGRAWLNKAWLSNEEPTEMNQALQSTQASEPENYPQYRMVRGGGWRTSPTGCRSAFRPFFQADSVDTSLGFRVVCLPPTPPPSTTLGP